MGTMSVIALAGSKRDLDLATQFPPDVKWDKIVRVEVPDSSGYGEFPDTSAYEAADFADFESKMEDQALFPYMTKCVDAVLDFTVKASVRLETVGFRNIHSSISGMKTGGKMFVVAGFVDYQPLVIDKRRPLSLIDGGKDYGEDPGKSQIIFN